MPLDDSLIYLQPVYLQSTGSAFPEFQRIVVASPRQVVWSATLGDALRLLLAAEAGASPGPSPGPTPTPTPAPTARSRRLADARRRRSRSACRPTSPASSSTPTPTSSAAQAALRDGDFARYGEEIALVKAALQRLEVLAPGLATPGAGASASPAP